MADLPRIPFPDHIPVGHYNSYHSGYADALRVERQRMQKVLAELFGMSTAWPVTDVLDKLADATQHLMNDHNCDHHGWELANGGIERARAYAASIRLTGLHRSNPDE